MTLLKSNQRAVIAADTHIDRLIIDRCVEAFDSLIDRDDLRGYMMLMGTAVAQMGYDRPVRRQDRPTAVDVIKTICLRAYADREGCSYQQAVSEIRHMMIG